MNHVEMEEIHKSLKDLSWPSLSSLGMRGDLSISHSICMSRVYGKDHVYVHNDLLDDYLHSFTIYVHAIDLSSIILP